MRCAWRTPHDAKSATRRLARSGAPGASDVGVRGSLSCRLSSRWSVRLAQLTVPMVRGRHLRQPYAAAPEMVHCFLRLANLDKECLNGSDATRLRYTTHAPQ